MKKTTEDDFAIDSAGRRRRLCDLPIVGGFWYRPAGSRCSGYSIRQLPDGRMTCTLHDPDRTGKCSQPVGWEDAKPNRFCSRAGPFENDGRLYCKQHDPIPRCREPGCKEPWTVELAPSKKGQRFVCALHAGRKPKGWTVGLCSLCDNTRTLTDERGAAFPCTCTPEGRQRANGQTDAEVLKWLQRHGFVEKEAVVVITVA